MKTKYKNLDVLLDQNAARQLAAMDSDRLSADIQRRLNHTCRQPRRRQTFVLRWTAGLSAAAAVVMAVFILNSAKTDHIELPAGQLAAVTLTEPQAQVEVTQGQSDKNTVAVVMIQPIRDDAKVSVSSSDYQTARCDVTVIDRNGHQEKDTKASWVIIIPSRPEEAENANDQEQLDIACLL